MSFRKGVIFLLAALGWFAIITQFFLMLETRKTDLPESIIRFFSYFTILSNILTAVYFTAQLSGKNNTLFARSASLQTAITLYITVVGLIYNTLLRGLVPLQGLGVIVDETLHTIIPILSVIYWYKWTDARALKWSNIFPWLIYPAIYCIYVLLRGSSSHFYPYPFMNADQLGYATVFLNCLGVLAVFLIFSVLFVWIGKRKRL